MRTCQDAAHVRQASSSPGPPACCSRPFSSAPARSQPKLPLTHPAGATWMLCDTWRAAGSTCLLTMSRRWVGPHSGAEGWQRWHVQGRAACAHRRSSAAVLPAVPPLSRRAPALQRPAPPSPAPWPCRWSGCRSGCAIRGPATSRAWTCCARPRSAASTPSPPSCWAWVRRWGWAGTLAFLGAGRGALLGGCCSASSWSCVL